MKTKGISLIVLVITILVLAILATTVIVSISNTNIIKEADTSVNKNNLQILKEAVNLKVISHIAENKGEIHTKKLMNEIAQEVGEGYTVAENNGKIKVFNEKVKVEVSNTGTVDGKLQDATSENLQIGDKVIYMPKLATQPYVVDEKLNDKNSQHNFNDVRGEQTFSTTQEELDALEWIYIGKDEATGRNLITTSKPINKTLYLYGDEVLNTEANKEAAAVNALNNLCKALYSSPGHEARSITIEDINRILGYTGDKGRYTNAVPNAVSTPEALTFKEIFERESASLSDLWDYPAGSKPAEEYLSSWLIIDKESNEITNAAGIDIVYTQNEYWLASACALVQIYRHGWLIPEANYAIYAVSSRTTTPHVFLGSMTVGRLYYDAMIRPVVAI